MAISGRPILDDFDDPVQALTDGIGQGSVDEGQDVDEVSTQCADERAQCGNATAQGSGHPGPEKLLCRGPIAVCPEVRKLVLEHPGAVDAAIGVPQAIQEAGMALGATSGVHAEEPPQPLDRLPAPRVEDTPLFLADLVHGLIQRLDEMEAVDDERHLGAVVRDRPDIGGAHVATGPGDTRFLSPAQPVVEEAIDGVTALA